MQWAQDDNNYFSAAAHWNSSLYGATKQRIVGSKKDCCVFGCIPFTVIYSYCNTSYIFRKTVWSQKSDTACGA